MDRQLISRINESLRIVLLPPRVLLLGQCHTPYSPGLQWMNGCACSSPSLFLLHVQFFEGILLFSVYPPAARFCQAITHFVADHPTYGILRSSTSLPHCSVFKPYMVSCRRQLNQSSIWCIFFMAMKPLDWKPNHEILDGINLSGTGLPTREKLEFSSYATSWLSSSQILSTSIPVKPFRLRIICISHSCGLCFSIEDLMRSRESPRIVCFVVVAGSSTVHISFPLLHSLYDGKAGGRIEEAVFIPWSSTHPAPLGQRRFRTCL